MRTHTEHTEVNAHTKYSGCEGELKEKDMGTFRQRQGQRCPGGGLFRKHLPPTPKEQTDDSPREQEHLTACTHTRTHTHTHTHT